MNISINESATYYLNNLSKSCNMNEPHILCPPQAQFLYSNDDKLYMKIAKGPFIYQKELIEIIEIKDALLGKYEKTGVFSPRVFAESQNSIPLHLSTQCIIVAEIKNDFDLAILDAMIDNKYYKGEYDSVWVTKKEIHIGQKILVMSRRVGGWDGSPEQPVIELLGAGGHVPCLWNGKVFSAIDAVENLQKEFSEELKFNITNSSFVYLGGFHNKVSNELVLLYCAFLNISDLPSIQNSALNNTKENINGIYLGDFDEIINMYLYDATHFAGGEEAKKSNFPSQTTLMSRIRSIIH